MAQGSDEVTSAAGWVFTSVGCGVPSIAQYDEDEKGDF